MNKWDLAALVVVGVFGYLVYRAIYQPVYATGLIPASPEELAKIPSLIKIVGNTAYVRMPDGTIQTETMPDVLSSGQVLPGIDCSRMSLLECNAMTFLPDSPERAALKRACCP